MAKILFLTQRIPYPPNKGEKIRSWQIFRHLAATHEIHLGCLIDDPADLVHRDTVRALCADSYFAPLDRSRAKVLSLRGLLTGEALSATFFRTAGLTAWVREVLKTIRPDIIFVSSSNMAPYVLNQPRQGETRMVDLVDVDSEKWRAYADEARGPMRWIYQREWARTAALERRIAKECDASVFVSLAEAALFARLAPQAQSKIRAISNGVDSAYFDPGQVFAPPYDPAHPNFVFTGTMDYPPNIDAVCWFAEKILPQIQTTLPQTCFHVVGANPTAAVLELTNRAGVTVTGRIPDVRPYLAHATAAVAPMRIARGIQNKVLEAMAMARSVIVTEEALEGIHAVAGKEVILAQTPQAFAEAACRVAAGAASEIGAAARRRVLADYAWASKLQAFDALLTPGLPLC